MNRILSLFKPNYPPVSILLENPWVAAVRVDKVGPRRQIVVRHEARIEEWGDGGRTPFGPQASDVESLLVRLGKPKNLSLVLEDAYFRSQIIKLSEFPRAEAERAAVIRWHLRKTVDYPVENARMRYSVLRRNPSAVSLWVSCVQEQRIADLEAVFRERDCAVGFIGTSSLELFNLAMARDMIASEGTTLILNRTSRTLSFLFVDEGTPNFFRCREPSILDGDEAAEDRLVQEIRITLAFYRERNTGSPLKRVLVRRWPPDQALPLEAVLQDEEILAMDRILPDGQADASLLPLLYRLEGC